MNAWFRCPDCHEEAPAEKIHVVEQRAVCPACGGRTDTNRCIQRGDA